VFAPDLKALHLILGLMTPGALEGSAFLEGFRKLTDVLHLSLDTVGPILGSQQRRKGRPPRGSDIDLFC